MPTELARIELRQSIMALQSLMEKAATEGSFEPGEYPLRHYFTPIDKKYGCAIYAREVSLPRGHVVIGEIHKRPHINFLMKGKLFVATEFGKQYFEAPCIIVSEAGTKRAAYIEEDVIWVTVHLVGEKNLDKVEDEIIAKSYDEFEALTSAQELITK